MWPFRTAGSPSGHSSLARRRLLAAMSGAGSRVGTSVSHTALFLRRQLWVWPIVAVVVLSFVGFGIRSAIESTIRDNVRSQLTTLLGVEVAMLRNWYAVQESNAEALANDSRVRDLAAALVESGPDGRDDASAALTKELAAAMESHAYAGYALFDRKAAVVASDHASLSARVAVPEYEAFVEPAAAGAVTVSPPFGSVTALEGPDGQKRTGEPVMFVAAPVRDRDLQVSAVLALQIRPEREFTRVLQLGRLGESGETYAFDAAARMVSNSRFDEDLILLGLLPDVPLSRSILSVLVHDPGGNVTEGFRPAVRRSAMPPTRMAASAIAGETAVDVDGYNDYRGVPVVGAWTWLPEYGIGVTTEVDVAEAYRPLTILGRAFWTMYALLVATSVAIFIFTIVVARLRREARRAAVEAKQLGQYTLQRKIGAGAMGVVYRGQHAMLRRPTAIKMLDVDRVNDDSIARFEREVQITCQLENPHTVAIYDYGGTPEGVFYYAMEYLDGIELEDLVKKFGPVPEERAVHVLRQMCASLAEAHGKGLVHRDVKPANAMLNRRGGVADFVKVLDFGLVRAADAKKQTAATSGGMTGTPLYMSPEAFNAPDRVDARSDLYAVGAVGYFLVTGVPVFEADLAALIKAHTSETPIPPEQRTDAEVTPEFSSLLLKCLAKDPLRRPQSARAIIDRLRDLPTADGWTPARAEEWWDRYEAGETAGTGADRTGTAARGPNRDRSGDDPPEYSRTLVR